MDNEILQMDISEVFDEDSGIEIKIIESNQVISSYQHPNKTKRKTVINAERTEQHKYE